MSTPTATKERMNPVTLTLTFASLDELHGYLNRSAADPRQIAIDFADRPDVGVSAEEKSALLGTTIAERATLNTPETFNPFAAAAEVAVAQVPPPPAPSTAVAAAVPIAPAVPPATSTPVPVPPAPALPTVPAAPAPAVSAAHTNPAGLELDRDGFPWDARIHASGRAKVADGTWRAKRGIKDTPELKAAVEAELRQAVGAPAAPASAVPLPPATATASAVATSPAPTAATPATPVVPSPPTTPPAAPSTPTETFATLMARVGPRLMAGQITEAQSLAVLAEIGLQSYTQLIQRPDLVPAAAARYDALVAA